MTEPTFISAGMVDIDGSFLFMLGLFLVFAFLLSVLVVKPLMKSQEKRYANMDGARRDASKAELAAAEARLGYESKLSTAKGDAVSVRDTERDAAVTEARSIVTKAEQAAEAKISEAQGKLDALASKARGELDTTSDELADILVQKILAKQGGR